MKKIETALDQLEREGRLRPVPKEDIEKFEKAMEKVIAECEEYRRRQAVLCNEARRRIICC